MNLTEWTKCLGDADATHCSAERAAADVILASLIGYNKSTRSHARIRDAQELAVALEAYALMLQRAELKIIDPEKP